MKTSVQFLVSFVLVATATGCAAEEPVGDAGDRRNETSRPSTPPEQTTSSQEESSKQAVSVTFKRSGGLAPTDETSVFAADKPVPSGRTRQEVRAVLEAASDPELIEAELEPMPKDQCCDRQTYVVSITWDDGSSRTYTSIDGVDQPQVFEELLTKLA